MTNRRSFPFLGILAYGILAVLLFCSRSLGDGIQKGLQVCAGLLIPSLFLFMIVSGWLMSCSLCEGLVAPFLPVGRLLRLSSRETAIFLLSLLGGYPVGARLLQQEVSAGRMSAHRASRLLCFCVNCGPAFLINGVGTRMLGNSQFGWFLTISQLAAGLTVAFAVSRMQDKNCTKDDHFHSASQPVLSALCESVPKAVQAMGTICSFTVAFSGILTCLEPLIAWAGGWLTGLCEVTAGCLALAGAPSFGNLMGLGLLTSLGGVCVWLQLYALLRGSGISLRRFFLFRPLYAGVSVGTLWVLTKLFPDTVLCFASGGILEKQIFSVSPISAFFLLVLTLFLLFFSKNPVRI